MANGMHSRNQIAQSARRGGRGTVELDPHISYACACACACACAHVHVHVHVACACACGMCMCACACAMCMSMCLCRASACVHVLVVHSAQDSGACCCPAFWLATAVFMGIPQCSS
eukprot:2525118-Prymnesium_polylepis.1